MEVQQRIILAAIELMSKNGVKHTTMDQVAQQLSISKRTIYEKFEDKITLITAIIKHLYKIADKNTQEIKNRCSDIIEELFETLTVMEEGFLVKGKITKDIEKHYPDIYQKYCVPQFEKTFYSMADSLNTGIEKKLFEKHTNTKFTVFLIFESINAMLNNAEKVQTVTGVSAFDTVRLIFINTFRGIATETGIKKIDNIIKQ